MHRYTWKDPQARLTSTERETIFENLAKVLGNLEEKKKKGTSKFKEHLDNSAKFLCRGSTIEDLHKKGPYGLGDIKADYAAEFFRALDDRRIADKHSYEDNKRAADQHDRDSDKTLKAEKEALTQAREETLEKMKSNGKDREALRRHFLREDCIGYHPDIAWMRTVSPICFREHESVVIVGERGTGKGNLVSAVHTCYKKKSDHELHTIAMGTLTDELAQSELFGHTERAFTGAGKLKIGVLETASRRGDTVYLDDLPEASERVQAMLLTAFEEGVIHRLGAKDVPIRIGTRRERKFPVFCSAQPGRLDMIRRDLRDRLSAMVFEIPPLRFRGPDIGFLAPQFLRSAYKPEGPPELSPEGYRRLFREAWHGNVRELDTVMTRVKLLRMAEGRYGSETVQEEELLDAMHHWDANEVRRLDQLLTGWFRQWSPTLPSAELAKDPFKWALEELRESSDTPPTADLLVGAYAQTVRDVLKVSWAKVGLVIGRSSQVASDKAKEWKNSLKMV